MTTAGHFFCTPENDDNLGTGYSVVGYCCNSDLYTAYTSMDKLRCDQEGSDRCT